MIPYHLQAGKSIANRTEHWIMARAYQLHGVHLTGSLYWRVVYNLWRNMSRYRARFHVNRCFGALRLVEKLNRHISITGFDIVTRHLVRTLTFPDLILRCVIANWRAPSRYWFSTNLIIIFHLFCIIFQFTVQRLTLM